MVLDIPGQENAEKLGYSLHNYSGNKFRATYIKRVNDDTEVIYLICQKDGTCRLEKIIGLITCTTGEMSFPNKNFWYFEKALMDIHG